MKQDDVMTQPKMIPIENAQNLALGLLVLCQDCVMERKLGAEHPVSKAAFQLAEKIEEGSSPEDLMAVCQNTLDAMSELEEMEAWDLDK